MDRRLFKSLFAALISVFMMVSAVNPTVFAEEPGEETPIQEIENTDEPTDSELTETEGETPEESVQQETPEEEPKETVSEQEEQTDLQETVSEPAPQETEEIQSSEETIPEDTSEEGSYESEESGTPDQSEIFAALAEPPAEGAVVHTLNPDDAAIDSFFTLTESVVVDGNKKKLIIDDKEVEISNRVKLGKNVGTASKNSVVFTVEEGYVAKAEIWAMSSNSSSGATLNVFGSDGAVGANKEIADSGTQKNPLLYEFTDLAAGEYYIASNDSSLKPANIYYIRLTLTPAAKETKIFTLNPDDAAIDSFFTLTESVVVDGNKKKLIIDDKEVEISNRVKLGKNVGTASKNSVVFTVEEGYVAKAEIWAMSSNSSSGATLNVFGSDGAVGANKEIADSGTQKNPLLYEFTDLAAGEYYIASNDSSLKPANIYYIRITETDPGGAPEPKERKPWEEVENPVIESVEETETGSLIVTFKAEFGYDGADSGRIFMMQDGFEVKSESVTKEGPVEFVPSTNGDFVFKAVITREKCADKESEPFTFENYALPPTAPAITWIDNLGDGKIYVDWNNVDADRGCKVEYKAEGSENYSTFATSVKTGNATITGLKPGTTYTIRVTADDSTSGTSAYERRITVGDPEQEWYADVFGSATKGSATVNGTVIPIESYDHLYPESANHAADVTKGSGEVLLSQGSSKNGKIADSEEGVQVYYTRINPNTENFKLTATFEMIPTANAVDNQSGYGIYAFDVAGLGTKDAKYMNSVAVGNFKLKDGATTLYHGNGVRIKSGFATFDPSSTAGSGNLLNNTNLFNVQLEDPIGHKEILGAKFTYTLEKTETGFIATMAGDSKTIEIPDVTQLMQQEDGSIVVAVASGRCDTKVTDITFEKSAGSVEGGGEGKKVTPKVTIYSSDETTVKDYEFIVGSNVPGLLTVLRGTKVLGSAKTDETTVAKIPVKLWNSGALNKITYKFSPKESEQITSSKDIQGSFNVLWNVRGLDGQVIYVGPDAPLNGLGTKEDPVDLQVALNGARPGQTIVMLDGTYRPLEDLIIPRNISGTEDHPITLAAEHTGMAKVTGELLETSSSLFTIVGSYWHIYGVEFCDTMAKGVSVAGNHNTIEMCVMHDTGNSGLQISRYAGEPNDKEMWPSYNLIKNCESYDNCDPGRNDADGFAAKLTCGEGNRFYGCISHHNIDDGWDLYAKSTTGNIGRVIIENSVAYSNGWLTSDDPTDPSTDFGEGNGFKLGGENMYGGHTLINSVSFNNYAKGVTSNSCPDNEIYNVTVFNNSLSGSAYNVSLYTKTSNQKAWKADGVLSIATNGTTLKELGASNGVIYSLRSATNYFFDGTSSFNTLGEEATVDWFENTDVSVAPTRNEDGTINMHGLLVLKESAPANTGARLNDSEKSEQPEVSGDPAVREVRYSVSDTLSEFSISPEVTEMIGAYTPEQVSDYMIRSVKTEGSGVTGAKVYEVIAEVSFDGGKTWTPATNSTFPTEGLDVAFPYPKGTSPLHHEYVVSHLSVLEVNGVLGGVLEFPEFTMEDDGIHLHVSSYSPFAIGWREKSVESTLKSITLEGVGDEIVCGEKVKLQPVYDPDLEAEKGVVWTSDHPEFISVDSYGTITGKMPGTAVITAVSTRNPNIRAQKTITATALAVDHLEAESDMILPVGRSIALNVKIVPENASDQILFYESADAKVARVDEFGMVTGVSAGRTTLKATSEDGGKTVEIEVFVYPDGIYIEALGSYPYTGNAVKPEVTVYDTGIQLIRDVDYTVKYENNINAAKSTAAKAPRVVIKGKGNYQDTYKVPFTIEQIDLASEEVTIEKITVEATAAAVSKAVPTIWYNGRKLKNKKDYTFTAAQLTEEGIVPITITAVSNGNFKGKTTVDIIPASEEKTPVSKLSVKTKTLSLEPGEVPTEERVLGRLTVKDGKTVLSNDSFEFSGLEDCTGIGTCLFVLSAREDDPSYSGSRTVSIQMTGTSVSKASASNVSLEYNGREQTLTPENFSLVLYPGKANEYRLTMGKDYEVVSYSKNLNAGNASAVIQGIGTFSGTKKVTYRITPSSEPVTVEVSDAEYSRTGAIPDVKITAVLDGEPVVLAEGIDYKLSFANNKAVAEKGIPSVTVSYLGNFKRTAKDTASFAIHPKQLSSLLTSAADLTYRNTKNTKANYKTKITLIDDNGYKLSAGKDYEKSISYFNEIGRELGPKETVPAGSLIRAVLTAKEGTGYTGTAEVSFVVKSDAIDISKASFTVKEQEYTGYPIEINTQKQFKNVSFGSGANKTTLVLGTDFIPVAFEKNLRKGTAKVTFVGIGRCSGVKTVRFKITKRNVKNNWIGMILSPFGF